MKQYADDSYCYVSCCIDSVSELEEVLESNLDSVAMQAGAQQLNIKIVLMGRRSGVRVSQDVALF